MMLQRVFNLPSQVLDYLRKVVLELRLMEWQTPRQIVRNTLTVAIMVVVFTLFLATADNIFAIIRNLILGTL